MATVYQSLAVDDIKRNELTYKADQWRRGHYRAHAAACRASVCLLWSCCCCCSCAPASMLAAATVKSSARQLLASKINSLSAHHRFFIFGSSMNSQSVHRLSLERMAQQNTAW